MNLCMLLYLPTSLNSRLIGVGRYKTILFIAYRGAVWTPGTSTIFFVDKKILNKKYCFYLMIWTRHSSSVCKVFGYWGRLIFYRYESTQTPSSYASEDIQLYLWHIKQFSTWRSKLVLNTYCSFQKYLVFIYLVPRLLNI